VNYTANNNEEHAENSAGMVCVLWSVGVGGGELGVNVMDTGLERFSPKEQQ